MKINESTLRKIISESIKRTLREFNESNSWSLEGREWDGQQWTRYEDYDVMNVSYDEAMDALENVLNNSDMPMELFVRNNTTGEVSEKRKNF